MMLIINSRFPFIHKLHAEVNTTYNMLGYDEAITRAREFNEVLKETEQHAQEVAKITGDIVKNIGEIEKRTPRDNMENAGIE